MNEIINLSRRDFLRTGALLGGGLVLGFAMPVQGSAGQARPGSSTPFAPNAFIRIGTDDSVTIVVNKSEMGQGVYTSLPMLVAEELEVDWSKVRVEAAPVDPAYNHTQWGVQGTGGSTSVRTSWDQLLKAGATARVMLVAAAARIWAVKPASCRAEKGAVVHEATKRRLSYGQLAEKAARLAPPQDVRLKPPHTYTIIGKPMKRLDTPEKISGKAVFGLDVRVPGMLTAVVARPPVFGATVKSVNDARARAVSGVKGVVRVDSGVAVVADHFWAAKGGRDALEVVWDEGPLATLDSKTQRDEYEKLAEKPGVIAARRGDVEATLAGTAKRIEAIYEVPYLAHAPMEPLNCVAHVRADGCDIWTGTQMQTTDRNAAAKLTGLPTEKVKLHTMLLGGGFGRRAVGDAHFVREAVQVSMAVKAPVKVVWTREDDIRGGYYRPVVYNLIRAGLGGDGMPVAWHHRIVGQSILIGTPFQSGVKEGLDPTQVEGAADSPYEIPNFLVDYHMAPPGVPVLWWRSVGHTFTAFVKEGFIDELAHLAGKDPYQYRRQLLAKHPRQRALLDLVADKAGWGKRSAPDRFQGIAVHESFGSFVAQVAEVSVSATGLVSVHRVACAIDCGMIVNPDTIAAQMESGIVFGLTAALYGEITFKEGRVEQSNFHDYEILRNNEMPKVEVHIMPSQEPPGGVGEPGVPPIAPAVVNALYAATGKRIRRLPIRPGELRRA
jgi:isoquinoline 1-oxidoreductase beta subunit